VLTTGETFVGRDMPVDLNRNGTGVLERRWFTFHYAAYRGSDGEPAGVVCHGTDVTEEVIARQEAQALDARMRTFFVLAENAPDGITVIEEGWIVYANPAFRRMLGLGEEGVGRLHAELLADESRETFQEVRSRQSAEGTWQGTLTYRRSDGSPFLGQVSSFAIPREGGGTSSEGCIVRDRTAELRHAVHEQVIAAQEREILELSTPLMPLAEGLVVMPLVGTINRARAALIMETLLQGITTQQAQVAILDITGVEVVDTHVANALLKTAQAASLLGTEVVLTGIKPDVARTLVAIEADLGRVKTHGTLQSAVAYAMGKSARRAP
jgi:PAS domain S-box-containing protein